MKEEKDKRKRRSLKTTPPLRDFLYFSLMYVELTPYSCQLTSNLLLSDFTGLPFVDIKLLIHLRSFPLLEALSNLHPVEVTAQ